VKLPVSQSADLSTRHKSLDIAVIDLGLNMNVGENLVWDLQFGIQIPAITVLNFVCIHPLD